MKIRPGTLPVDAVMIPALAVSPTLLCPHRLVRPQVTLYTTVTIRKYCGARPGIHGLTCELTSGNHMISEYLHTTSDIPLATGSSQLTASAFCCKGLVYGCKEN